jgi:hypothetical protein
LISDLHRAFRQLTATLDSLAIPYMIGGSLASSVHGIYRSTNDIDIVAAVREKHVVPLVTDLAKEFYADLETVQQALRLGRPFNLIHYASGYKFDIFPAAGNPYFEKQLERSTSQEVSLGDGESMRCSIATAEDTILAKLVWYRAGGEQSERQWNDVRGVCSTQGDRLDGTYLRQWARDLGVEDLLERLLSEERPA